MRSHRTSGAHAMPPRLVANRSSTRGYREWRRSRRVLPGAWNRLPAAASAAAVPPPQCSWCDLSDEKEQFERVVAELAKRVPVAVGEVRLEQTRSGMPGRVDRQRQVNVATGRDSRAELARPPDLRFNAR